MVNYYALNGALHKYVNTAGVWSQAPTYPRSASDFSYSHPSGQNVAPYGLKTVIGYRRPDGNLILVSFGVMGGPGSNVAIRTINRLFPRFVRSPLMVADPRHLLLEQLHPDCV